MSETESIIWTSGEAAIVTGGMSTHEWYATGVSLNASEIKPGDLYIATPDDNLEEVFHKGAVAAMVSKTLDIEGDWPLLKVASVFEALQSLAAAGRYKTHGMIVSVPSCTARQVVHDLLIKTASVYEGGRHLSVGLAGIPEDIEYGLFGSSPAVKPDITVIANCAATNSDVLFEAMPAYGSVIINADSDAFLSTVARAKAAGVQNIFTYGSRDDFADACIQESVQVNNGMRMSVNILGEELSFVAPLGMGTDPAFVAGFLVLKITGQKLSKVVKALEISSMESKLFTGDVSLIDPIMNKERQAVFRIKNMIDLGFGRQTAVLDGLVHSVHKVLGWPMRGLEIPSRFSSLDLVYTSKKFATVLNAHEVIKDHYKNAQIEEIAPDVVAPGDFLVFKDRKEQKLAIFSEALRLTLPNKYKKIRMKHAL
ncbi:MAG: hypothetical protein KAJ86_03700 [Alphaproteobacteria bacterium]|nr:hypothetical protein [Alphaproteobacteria bacterium]